MRLTTDERGAERAEPSPPTTAQSSACVELRKATPGTASGLDEPDTRMAVRPGQQPDRVLCCVGCGHAVTRERMRVEVAGRHEHTCVNPAGYTYRIACFRAAPGAVGVGEWSSFFSWFEGHVWQVACCASCSMHLGWGFEPERSPRTERRFHGLIRDRLREAPDSPPEA